MHPHYSIGIAHDNPRLILSIGEFHDKDEKRYQIWDLKSFVKNQIHISYSRKISTSKYYQKFREISELFTWIFYVPWWSMS